MNLRTSIAEDIVLGTILIIAVLSFAIGFKNWLDQPQVLLSNGACVVVLDNTGKEHQHFSCDNLPPKYWVTHVSPQYKPTKEQ